MKKQPECMETTWNSTVNCRQCELTGTKSAREFSFEISNLKFGILFDFASSLAEFVIIREIRVFSPSVFIRVHPWLNSSWLRLGCALRSSVVEIFGSL